jgi:hypothetical protein
MRLDNSTAMSDNEKHRSRGVTNLTKMFKLLIRMVLLLPPDWAICRAALEIATSGLSRWTCPQSYQQKLCISEGARSSWFA